MQYNPAERDRKAGCPADALRRRRNPPEGERKHETANDDFTPPSFSLTRLRAAFVAALVLLAILATVTVFSTVGSRPVEAQGTADFSVSNLGQGNVSPITSNVQLGADLSGQVNENAQKFTTGSSPKGYRLDTVIIDVAGKQNSPGSITAKLAVGSGTNPGSALATLSGSASSVGQHTYTCVHSMSNNCNLAKDTFYFIHLTTSGTNNNYYWMRVTGSDNETTAPANNGWSIDNEMRRKRGLSWQGHLGRSLKIKVSAVGEVPPTVWATSGDVIVPESDRAHTAGLWGFGLSYAPDDNVTYTITSSNPSKVKVSPTKGTFTTDKYTTPVVAEGLQDADDRVRLDHHVMDNPDHCYHFMEHSENEQVQGGSRTASAIYTVNIADDDGDLGLTLTRDHGTVAANWNAIGDATKYWVTYSADGGSSWSQVGSGSDNVTDTSITISNADNTKPYIVAVRAGNQNGWWPWVNSAPAAPYAPQGPPGHVAESSISVSMSNNTMTASWTKVTGATKYEVTVKAQGHHYVYSEIVGDVATVTFTNISGKAQHQSGTYWFGIRAGNSAGWSAWKAKPVSRP